MPLCDGTVCHWCVCDGIVCHCVVELCATGVSDGIVCHCVVELCATGVSAVLQVGEAAERLRGTQSQASQSTGAVQEGPNISHS